MPKALLVTQKAQASPLFRAMSLRFKGRAQFAAVTGSQAPELQGELGIERLPGIVLLPVQGGTVTYGGAFPIVQAAWSRELSAATCPFQHAIGTAWGSEGLQVNLAGTQNAAALYRGPVPARGLSTACMPSHAGQAKAAELAPFLEEHVLPEAAGAVKGPKDPAALELGPVEMTHLGEAERLAEAPGAWLVGLFAGACRGQSACRLLQVDHGGANSSAGQLLVPRRIQRVLGGSNCSQLP